MGYLIFFYKGKIPILAFIKAAKKPILPLFYNWVSYLIIIVIKLNTLL